MSHSKNAATFLKDQDRAKWHDQSIWYLRERRDNGVRQIPEWEELRELASQIKANVLSNLDQYLIQFEEQATNNGAVVHWAKDAQEHNQIVLRILRESKIKNIVKSKSMLTEECHLNPYLEKNGISVVDTDLGERIVQLREEAPSHIITPAIHIKKEEVGDLFHEHLGTEAGANDPKYLTEAARQHLRSYFLDGQAGITGVNFAIAETGGVVVVTNEGNADLGVHLHPVQIHCMGIEKIIPRQIDLGVFTRVLARSATGQALSIYTSHYHRPKPGGQMHIVIVDNGRTEQLGRPDFRKSLACIRCGACMNTCPIYRRSGGYSYEATVPGPIGSILSPGIDLEKHADLPFASSLCGSCSDVCPVKIDIHDQLYKWRQLVVKNGYQSKRKRGWLQRASHILSEPELYVRYGKKARWYLKKLPKWMIYNRWNVWGKQRELPQTPKESFKEWYNRT
ncbi:MAG: lactate utilization protein B, partial [Cyclobacteriaceae bacterium]